MSAAQAQLGIDIGSSSIKIVELTPTSGRQPWKLVTAASIAIDQTLGVAGVKTSVNAFAQAIATLLKQAGIKTKRVVASLPEEQVFSHVIEMPLMTEDELDLALQWQVDQYIPIPADQANWSRQIISQDKQNSSMQIFLVASSKALVSAYQEIMTKVNLELVVLETELMSTARSVVSQPSPVTLVVDIGSKSTDIGIVENEKIIFTRTVGVAGDSLTRAIQSNLNIDLTQAEQYKNTYGFSASMADGKLAEAMKPVITSIVSEINKTSDFYVSKHPQAPIKQLVLAGGVSIIPEMISVLSANLGMEVKVGNPFDLVKLDDLQAKELAGKEAFYAVAVGLAMRQEV